MDNRYITVRVFVKADIDTVWESWNKPEHITKWCFASDDWGVPEAKNDLHVGGKFNTRMEAKDKSMGFNFIGTYTAVEENELIEYTIVEDHRHVKIQFDKSSDGVEVIEMFEPEKENSLEMQREGWQSILNNFKKYVESRK